MITTYYDGHDCCSVDFGEEYDGDNDNDHVYVRINVWEDEQKIPNDFVLINNRFIEGVVR